MAYNEEIAKNNEILSELNGLAESILNKANSLPEPLDTSDATALAEDIIDGKTAYINGGKTTGTLSSMGSVEGDLTSSIEETTGTVVRFKMDTSLLLQNKDKIVLDGNSTITDKITKTKLATAFGVTGDKIVKGNTILGIAGTGDAGIDTSDATALAGDILENKLAYGKGQAITGTMKNLGNVNVEPDINDESTIAQNGYVSNVVVPSIKTSIELNSKYAITGNYSSAGPNATSVSGSVTTTIGNGVLAFIMTREEIDLTSEGWTHIGHNNLVTNEGWLQYLYVYGKIATEETTTLTLSGGSTRRAITLLALNTPNLPECVYNQAFNKMTNQYLIGEVKTDDIVTSAQFWSSRSGPWYGMSLTGVSATKYYNAGTEDRLNVFKVNSGHNQVYINTGNGANSQITVMILRYPEALNSEYIRANTKILDVVGTFTSDANAIPSDIAEGKTAYVNGEKITGTLVTGEAGSETEMSSTSVEWSSFQNALYAYEDFTQDYLFRQGARLSLRVPTDVLAEAIGLTADKIKAGEVIMGITGTYEADYTSTLTPEEYTTALNTASSILNDEVTE